MSSLITNETLLKLYRASAGSGKTFTLAVEYIKLLIINQKEYKHILAVTFTNKATAEMKGRILSTLYGLANHLSDAENYLNVIRDAEEIKALHIDDEEIRRRAGIALNNLAHDYSRFHIETIDSFFVSVIKDLARELDLTANLNIDLNADEVLAEAIDNIIDGLSEGSDTLNSLKSFIDEKIDSETSWKIDKELNLFGKNIFDEHYQSKKDSKTLDGRFMAAYRKSLQKAKADILQPLQDIGNAFLQSCTQHGFTADDFFQKKKGVWTFFTNLAAGKEIPTPNSYVLKCGEEAKVWNAKNAAVQKQAEEEYLPMLTAVLKALPQASRIVNTVNAVSKHLYHLQLLSIISTQVDRLNNDANRFLLANSAHFLQRMIDKSNVPFIYEKSGTTFNHIMIDEFQDTSALQWDNFLPLLVNSLDSNQSCLIVGDVKQSIYRFRNSDWQILNTLGDTPQLQGKIDEKTLGCNRRSLGNIIQFNNTFFQNAVAALNADYQASHGGEDSTQLLRAYSDVAQQQLAEKKGLGYVRVEILRQEDKDDQEAGTYQEATLTLLLSHVQELIAAGIPQRDICILTRYNRHIPLISNHFALNAPEIKLISDEAYRLDASLSVNILILALKHLTTPEDPYILLQLTNNCQHLTSQESVSLPPTLIYEPLKEIIGKIYVMLHLERIPEQDAYLFYFFDQLAAYTENGKADINSFLSYWDEQLSAKTIPGCVSDGVRIMSIHKSKGLEFPTVIIPFCDWDTTGKSSQLLWCTPTTAPFDQLQLLPVNFDKTTRESLFSEAYEEEVLRNNVDNLNLLYVAFTRAADNLFIITQEPKQPSDKQKAQDNTIKDIKKLIQKSLPDFMVERQETTTNEQPSEGHSSPTEERLEEGYYALSYGTLVTAQEEKNKGTDNVLTKPYQKEPIRFHTSDTLPEFRQSNKSKDFIAAQTEEAPDTKDYIDKGLLYHSILQRIRTLDDIDQAIEQADMEGCFHSAQERKEASRHIHAALDDPYPRHWFDGTWKIINERTMLCPVNAQCTTPHAQYTQLRADRVITRPDETIVIDYKTGHPRKEHEDQVRTYMQQLQAMGYPNVKGYLWYIMANKTYRVKEK